MLDTPYIDSFEGYIEIVSILKTMYDAGNPKLVEDVFGDYVLDNDIYGDIFYSALDNAAEFVYNDYLEGYEVDKWFLSSTDMTDYYKLSYAIGRVKGIAKKDNPYVLKAESILRDNLCFNYGGLDVNLYTGTHHKYASSVIVYVYPDFGNHLAMANWLIKVFAYYSEMVVELRQEFQTLQNPPILIGRAA